MYHLWKIPLDWHPLNKESLRGFRSARPELHHHRMIKQISPSQLLPPRSGHLPSSPRSWSGSFQLGDPEQKLISLFNHCLPWLQADGSVDKRHGEQGKAGTRPERQGLFGLSPVWLAESTASKRRKPYDVNVERTNTGTSTLQERAGETHWDWQPEAQRLPESGSCGWKAVEGAADCA